MEIQLSPGLQVFAYLSVQLTERLQEMQNDAGTVEMDADTEEGGMLKLRLRYRHPQGEITRQLVLSLHTTQPMPGEREEHFTMLMMRTRPRLQRSMVYFYTLSAAKAARELTEIIFQFILTGTNVASLGDWKHLVAVK